MRMYASVERGHTFRYLVPSWTRSSIISSPAGREVSLCIHHLITYLITRANKREVDHYNCPLIGGGEIGLVKEIQLVGTVRTHVLSPKTGRSTTTRDRWLVASQPQSIVTQKLDEVFVHANNPTRSAI